MQEMRESWGSIPGSGRSPGEGNGNPLQYSCLENPMGRGAWGATVHGVAKSRTRLSTWKIVDLPCCVSFWYTAKSFGYTCAVFQILFSCRLLQDAEYSSLCCTAGPCCYCFVYSRVYLRIPSSWFVLLPLGPLIVVSVFSVSASNG